MLKSNGKKNVVEEINYLEKKKIFTIKFFKNQSNV